MINKVILTQPNYLNTGKRTYKFYPLSLGILNACINKKYSSMIFDPNINNMSDDQIIDYIKKENPDVIGITSCSTEYIDIHKNYAATIREAAPKAIIIQGGILPTVDIKSAMNDKSIDFWIIGEGEETFIELLDEINSNGNNYKKIKGISYFDGGRPIITEKRPFINNLDRIPFPDYGNIDIMVYANQTIKMAGILRPRKFPYATMITSRGCPYSCIFCASATVSGKKVRMRSVENVLKEVDEMYRMGIRDIIFLDDHFLFNKERALDIMRGIRDGNYKDLIWKIMNLTVWILDEELINTMAECGCYQVTISVESGDEYIVKNVIKKGGINLKKVPAIVKLLKEKNIEVISNWIIGFPQETWEQIRRTLDYAEKLDTDLANIHIATPLPGTELMDICINGKYFIEGYDYSKNIGYTKSNISTPEFTPIELEVLRAFEWDRINFNTEEKRKRIAKIQGLTMEELNEWRKQTRRTFGIPTDNWGDNFKTN